MAARQRSEALTKYLASPSICKRCGKPILPAEGQKVSEVRLKQFCNQSCSASFQNAKRPKIGKSKISSVREALCQRCGVVIVRKKRKNFSYNLRRYCDSCVSIARIARFGVSGIALRTKADVFAKRKNWQSARSSIRYHAFKVFLASGAPLICAVCGYKQHVEICHIQDVSSFPESALISEVNALPNLVALCPNHHWEFDRKLLKLPAQLSHRAV